MNPFLVILLARTVKLRFDKLCDSVKLLRNMIRLIAKNVVSLQLTGFSDSSLTFNNFCHSKTVCYVCVPGLLI